MASSTLFKFIKSSIYDQNLSSLIKLFASTIVTVKINGIMYKIVNCNDKAKNLNIQIYKTECGIEYLIKARVGYLIS